MNSEFNITLWISEQYIITTGPQCYLSFLKSYVPPHWFVVMCHNNLFSCCRSDFVGSPGSCGGRRRWIRRPFRYLNQEKSYFIGNIVRLFLSEGSSWIVNSSSVASRCSPPPEKCTVPTNKSSLKLSTRPLGEPWADLHHSQYFVARSQYLESKKWPFDNTLCAHLSVAWRVSSPRPLGVSAGGPRLLESTVWSLGSASWAALWHKICGRVHW